MKKIIATPEGIKELDLTADEITAKQAEEAQAVIDKQTIKDAETQKENDKVSAQNKLKALGLTDAEIEAFRGK